MEELVLLFTFALHFMEDSNMQITIDIDNTSSPSKSVTVEADGHERVDAVVFRALTALGIDPSEFTADIGIDDISFEPKDHVKDCIRHGQRWRCRQVCVDINYQSESAIRHFFNPKHTWQNVHEWACKHFRVAAAVCKDLELFAGSSTGPALNENLPIGASSECKIVWLAKPGPELNGY